MMMNIDHHLPRISFFNRFFSLLVWNIWKTMAWMNFKWWWWWIMAMTMMMIIIFFFTFYFLTHKLSLNFDRCPSIVVISTINDGYLHTDCIMMVMMNIQLLFVWSNEKNKNKSVTKDDIYRQSSFEKKEQVILNNKLYRIYEICVSYQYFIFIDSISQVCVCVHVCLSWCGDIKNGLCHDLFSLLSNILQKKKIHK